MKPVVPLLENTCAVEVAVLTKTIFEPAARDCPSTYATPLAKTSARLVGAEVM